MAVLSARDVSINFGGLKALSDMNFEVNENEIVGIIGPNGAGKTTFFNCVTGFYTPTEGDVFINGEKVTDLRPDERTVRSAWAAPSSTWAWCAPSPCSRT
jgi:branched-chain amino acid transport system ATP-binding protein